MTVLDVNAPNVRTQLPGHPTWIRALAVSADGMLVSGGGTPSVKVWDVGGAREKAEVTPSVSLHTTLAVSPDGEWIAVGGWSGTIEVRELATGRTKQFGHIGTISSLAFSPDGSILASTGEDGTVKTWDFRREHDRVLVQGSQRTFSHLAYSPDGRLLAIANRVHGTLELREVPSGRLLRSNTAADMRRFAAFSPDGRILVGGPSFLWDVDAEQELQSPSFAFGRAAAFSPDNRILAVGGGDGQKGFIELWDWKASKKLAELQGHSRSVRAVSMSPDGKTLASASAQGNFTGEVILWEVSSGQRKHTLEHACVRVAYSPDGKLLASGSRSGGIALWDPDTGRLLKDIVGHTRYTGSLAFVPDGKTIISCNMLKGVSLWDVEKGIERATLSRSELSVSSIAISPDGKTFATVSREGSLDIWRTASAAEVRAQSAWFDPRLRLARKYEADARMFQKGLRPKDALRASSLAEQLYQELASEFPDRHPVVYESGTARQ